MKLPEEPTKKVREILAIKLQCPGYSISDRDLYEIKKLCDCLDTTISTMKLHAGDCCSLNNEVGLFKSHWDDAEERCDELEKENKKLEQIISDIEDWGIVISDESLLKLIKALKAGECHARPTGGEGLE